MNPTFKQRFRYFFDNTLSRGTASIIVWLTIITVVLVVVFAGIYTLIGIHFEDTGELNFLEAFWQSLMRSLDPGTVAGDTIWGLRIIGIIVTISGIFILSSLIGILSSGLEAKLDELRKGRSIVLKEDHTLIIGWSQKIFHIISELIIANENQKKPSIVILADRDKVEMDDILREKIPFTGNTKIITRTGDPLDSASLKIVNADGAKSIIILSPEDESESSKDIHVIKSVLALTFNPQRTKEQYHIVAEIMDIENLDAAEVVGKNDASFFFTQDVIARITAQTSHQPGLSVIYMDLLCYDGDELYFQQIEQLNGKTFKDAIFAFEDSTVLGYKNSDGKIHINPPMDSVLKNDDEILAISEDDDTIIPSGKTTFDVNEEIILNKERASSVSVERNIILGWNQRAGRLIHELDEYVAEGSSITIVCLNEIEEDVLASIGKSVKNQEISFIRMDYSKRKSIIELDITSFDNVIVLSNSEIPPQEGDAMTILALIHIRNLAEQTGRKLNIISEMHDQKNRELAEVTEADDFIISHDLISRMLAQVSESKELKIVFDSLFDSEGSEIYLKDVTDYVESGKPVNFYTILESASLKNETALGYRKVEHSYSSEHHYGIVVNPKKSEMITFQPEDKVIVLSED
ncbi:MAG: NAD-binding protein [Bacteroidales bacterium]|nr:NAD-binding protein [Bacteroidales bacterium]